MGQHMRIKTFLILLTLSAGGCLIHPPSDSDIMGPEVSAADIMQAVDNAEVGNRDTVVRVGDWATRQSVTQILTTTKVTQSVTFTVTGIDATNYYYKRSDDTVNVYSTQRLDRKSVV